MITKKPVLRLISLVMSVLLLISFNSLAFWLLFLLPKKNTATGDQVTKDAKDDQSSIIRAGFWSGQINDKIIPPWNYFHNAVQNHIEFKYEQKGIEKNEMTFDDKTRVDLYRISR